MSELASTLDKKGDLPNDPDIKAKFVEFTNLIKIKTADNALQQLRNTKTATDGERVKLMSEVAALLDKNGNLPTDTATRAKFDKFVSLTSKKNEEDAMQQLRNTKDVDRSKALPLMSKLAALLDKNGELPSQYNNDFDTFVQLTKLKDRVVAMQQLRNTKAIIPKKIVRKDVPDQKIAVPDDEQWKMLGFDLV